MPESIPSPISLERDGASQSERRLPCLDTETVGIDERGLADWLAFAQAYSQELMYYDLDNQPGGDWSGFLNPVGLDGMELPAHWREIEGFLAEPGRFDAGSAHRRPHLVLFLAFLRLLGLSQQRLNRLTRQHLDFYYRQFLSLERQAALPDRVNLLAGLSADVTEVLLPQGTLLDAGKDSQGEDLFYRTDEDRVVNRAQVKRLCSVFVDKKLTGIRQAREACVETQADPLLAMFAIVYGEPVAGDPLPDYRPGQPLDAAFLAKLGDLTGFVGGSLRMDFQEFRTLMRIKNVRDRQASADWGEVNGMLEIVGKAKARPDFTIQPADSPDFMGNLNQALANKALDFASLPNAVTGLEDLYAQRTRKVVQDFIHENLGLTPDQFKTMMDKKLEIDNDWRIVNGLLEAAGQRRRKDPDYRLVPDNPASPRFDQNVLAALGTDAEQSKGALDFSVFKDVFDVKGGKEDLDRFNAALRQVEGYFFCSLEDFTRLMEAGKKEKQTDAKKRPTPAEWTRVYGILAGAYAKKVYAGRQDKLDGLRHPPKPQRDALEAMLRLALGERSLSVDGLLGLLDTYWPQGESGKKTLAQLKAALTDNNPPDLKEGWKDIVEGLELAWRKREGAPPVAQKEEWRNLYANEDATAVMSANLGGTPRWRTFGQGRLDPPKDQPPAPLLGWAIASPVFCLGQGQRDVTLTLVFQAGNYDSGKIASLLKISGQNPAYPFQIEASSEKGWVAPDAVTIESGGYSLEKGWVAPDAAQAGSADPKGPPQDPWKALRFSLRFDVSAPPIAALPDAESRWPMIRLMLRPVWKESVSGGGRYETPYPLFQGLALERVLIQAKVHGLKDLRLANDEGSLSADKPFEPFGFSPSAGSVFQFVHPELVIKRLDWLDAKLQWMKVPDAKLAAHYKNYPIGIKANSDFTVTVSQVDHSLEITLAKAAALFDLDDAGKASKISISDIPGSIQASRPGYAYLPEHAPFSLKGPSTWQRYWRFELTPTDFQHGSYAKVSAAKSIEFSAAIAASLKPDSKTAAPSAADYQVNPPYTPKLKSFSIDYGCSVEIVMRAGADAPPEIRALGYGRGAERIFHRQAFGAAEIQPEQDTGLCRFLPAYGHEGELCIGLEGASAPQDVAVLFQMAEGSANPDLAPAPVEWSYLSGNRWVSLRDGGLLADSTRGLAESGIITFRLPQAQPNTLLPTDLYWLRAAVARDCDSVCDTVAIHAQAVSATWVGRDNAADHLNQPLPAGTITKTADSVPGILAIRQPYTSFGGKPGEEDARFNARVSERLRHKQRALTLWDYEHLILERFPGIHKAKCIPASSTEPGELGKVDIIVIPDIRNHLPFNPFEPKATASQIAEIASFLESHVPDLAEINVKNAYYVAVRVRFAVRFMPGCDAGFYTPRLNEELNRFLSPWAYEGGNEVVIGGKIYANAIVDFLERRPYVDYVAELKLFINEDGLGFKRVADTADGLGYRVQTDRPDGVLVGDPRHEIDLITESRFEDAKFTGIGHMKIELDFIVA